MIKEYTEKDAQLANEITQWLKEPTTWSIPKNLVGLRFFLYESGGEQILATRINYEMIRSMMKRDADNKQEGTLSCYIGGMKKTFLNGRGEPLRIKPTVVRRMACVNDWWETKAPRFFFVGEKDDFQALSYPNGYLL